MPRKMTPVEVAIFAAVYAREYNVEDIRAFEQAGWKDPESQCAHVSAEIAAAAVLQLREDASSILEGFEGTDFEPIFREAFGLAAPKGKR